MLMAFEQDIQRFFDNFQIEVEEKGLEFLQEQSERQIETTRKRTRSGDDYEDNKFTGYRPPTKDIREKAGFQTDTVELWFEGDPSHMLDDMIYEDYIEPNELESKIFFKTEFSRLKAAVHQFGLGNLPIREFLGFSDSELEQMTGRLRSFWQ